MIANLYRLVAVSLGLWLLVGTLPSLPQKLTASPVDSYIGQYTAQQFIAGQDPCAPEALAAHGITGLGQPPTVALWFLPFAALPSSEMTTDLRMLTILTLAASLILLSMELGATAPIALSTMLFGYILSRQFFQSHLDVAQISEFIALWIILAWFFLRSGSELEAGVCLGLACTLKLFPAVIGLFLLSSRRWRGLAAMILTYSAAIAVVTIRWGWRLWPHFFESDRVQVDYWVSTIHNGSLYGIVTRLFQHCSSRLPPSRTATLVYLVLMAALVLLFLYLARNTARSANWEPAFGFVAVLAPFLHPVMWEHYAVLWILPIGLAVKQLGRPLPAWQKGLVGFGIFMTCFFMTLPMHYRSLFMREYLQSPRIRGYLHFYEIGNWLPSILLLMIFAFFLTRRTDSAIRPATSPP